MKIEIQPWMTPSFIMGVMPASQRQDGFNPDSVPKWHIMDVDAQTLSDQCDRFRRDVFAKANTPDPYAPPTKP